MKKITQCRACGSKALTEAFKLAAAPVTQSGRGGVFPARRREETEFVLCDASVDAHGCGLLQSAYASAATPDFEPSGRYALNRSHLRAAATEALELISGRDCAALDIGCDDGTLLSYYPRWVERHGVDPSTAVDGIGDWSWSAQDAFPSQDLDRAFGEKKFDIVTAVSVLEWVDDPRAFLARVQSLLSADGVCVLETLYAPVTLTQTRADIFLSGAKSIYALGVLERLVRDSGLKIFRGALTDKEGGSIRLFLTHAGVEDYDFDPWYERLARLWDEENALSLRSLQSYQAFARRAEGAREALQAMLGEVSSQGESVHLLGVGPQSRAVLNWAGAQAKVVSAAVCDGAWPEGRLSGNGPAVITETDCRASEPDYLLAPAALKREMMERWRESILLGAKLIVATPEPHVVHRGNYAAELGKALAGCDSAGGVETLRAILGAVGAPRLIAETPERQVAASG